MIPMATQNRPGDHPDDASAAAVFGTALRIAIIHYLARHPSSMSGQLARALQVPQPTIGTNLAVLEAHGALRADSPSQHRSGRRVHWSVDADRCRALIDHLASRTLPPD